MGFFSKISINFKATKKTLTEPTICLPSMTQQQLLNYQQIPPHRCSSDAATQESVEGSAYALCTLTDTKDITFKSRKKCWSM